MSSEIKIGAIVVACLIVFFIGALLGSVRGSTKTIETLMPHCKCDWESIKKGN